MNIDIEGLKRRKHFVQYIVPDNPSKISVKRMQYYVNFSKDPDTFYFNTEVARTEYKKEKLEKLVEEGKLIKLPNPVTLPYIKDLFLTADNTIIMAIAWDSEKGQKLVHAFRDK